MRILTGVHREAYENLIAQNAQLLSRVKWLEQELERGLEREKHWEGLWERANKRAEQAIDAQLAVRGFPPVTPREGMPDLPDALEEDPEKVADLEARLLRGDATVFTEPR